MIFTLLHTLAFGYNNGLSETIVQSAPLFASKPQDSKPLDNEEQLSSLVRQVSSACGVERAMPALELEWC